MIDVGEISFMGVSPRTNTMGQIYSRLRALDRIPGLVKECKQDKTARKKQMRKDVGQLSHEVGRYFRNKARSKSYVFFGKGKP